MQLSNIPLVLVPCFSGAPWETDQFPTWRNRTTVAGRFPDLGPIDAYATAVESWAAGIDSYVLVGDSFGALVSLALAARRPRGLRAVVVSGGFARAEVSLSTRLQIRMAGLLGQPGYGLTIRGWVKGLGSRFDPPGTAADLERIFRDNSDARTFVNRAKAVFATDLRPVLSRIEVPTLVLTPEEDRLIGPGAAAEMVNAIPVAEETVLRGTGHLLRFTHPEEYARAIDAFLARHEVTAGPLATNAT